jgi:hypothetical protein
MSHANNPVSSSQNKQGLLSNSQIKLLDNQAAKAVPECSFIYHKAPIGSVTGKIIFECIEKLNNWFWSYEHYKVAKLSNEKVTSFRLLDDYLGSRVIPYVLELHKSDQAQFLRRIALSYSENLSFMLSLIKQGVSVGGVLLQEVNDRGGMWVSCNAYKIFLNKNLALYQDNKRLYEPILESIRIYEPHPDASEMLGIQKPYYRYRWEDLHYLYNICPESIERLVRAKPELLNKRQRYDGSTPLHLYLAGSFMQSPSDIQLVSTLATSVNINMRARDGNTPLHEFLINTNPTNVANIKKVIKMMIARGADINLKNNKGITVKSLILKRKDLSENSQVE